MATLVRTHDPSITVRRIPLVVQESAAPGLVQFLNTLQYGTETPLIRGVLYQWYLTHKAAGTLDQAISDVLSGPGGRVRERRASRTMTEQLLGRPQRL